MVMNFVWLWEICPTTLNTDTHIDVCTPSPAHLSHLLKRSASEVHSVDTSIVSLCLGQSSVDSLTVKLHWALSVSCPRLHSLIIPTLFFLLVPFCIHCGSTCFSTSPLSVYYKAHCCKHFWIQVFLPGKIKVWKCMHLNMLMVASIR